MIKNKFSPVFYLLFLFLGFAPLILKAQGNNEKFPSEKIMPLISNAQLKQLDHLVDSGRIQSQSLQDTLFLPFFDDFSKRTVWPAAEHFSDSSVFVNYNFPINPPSVGAVTFDGLDKFGDAYNNTNASAVGLCDQLTSRYLNLANDQNGLPYAPSDSIYLIFYFQRKGRGDKPETSDSLTLQFYNPSTQSWLSVWSAVGNATGDTSFTKVRLKVDDPGFRQNGFRFRFSNYGSQNGMLDIWNVDYIYLNKFLPPDYDNIRDYAFVNEGVSLLRDYSSVPWVHYKNLTASQQTAMMLTAAQLTLRNNNDASPFAVKVTGTIRDLYGNTSQIFGGSGTNSITIPLNSNINPPSSFTPAAFFNDPVAATQTKFDVIYDIGQTSGGGVVDDFSMNDTLICEQHFYDYYSYDDGTAELAYGINGISAKLAYRFDLLQGDTLRAINMFFAQSGLSVASQQFRLAVWQGGASGPVGNPVYEKPNQSPMYVDSLNQFKTYLTDPIYLSSGTWYFGFIQNSAALLNIGLDVNTPADPSKKYINTSGNWTTSQLPGMWMIRPVFSGSELYSGIDDAAASDGLTVFPNPTEGIVHLKLSSDMKGYRVKVNDVSGRQLQMLVDNPTLIDFSSFTAGIYFVTLCDNDDRMIGRQKICVSK